MRTCTCSGVLRRAEPERGSCTGDAVLRSRFNYFGGIHRRSKADSGCPGNRFAGLCHPSVIRPFPSLFFPFQGFLGVGFGVSVSTGVSDALSFPLQAFNAATSLAMVMKLVVGFGGGRRGGGGCGPGVKAYA